MGIVVGIASSVLDYDTANTVAMVSSICFGLLNVVLGILIAFLLPAAIANYAVKGTIGDGLRIGEVFGMVKNNLSAYLLVFVGMLAASFIASLGTIACGIGVLLTTVYANTIIMHLYGQAYKKATGI